MPTTPSVADEPERPWRTSRAGKPYRQAALGILVLAACLSFAWGLHNAVFRPGGSQDTQWEPSRVLLEHSNPYARVLRDTSQRPFLAQNPNYPASGLVMLWPYAVWSWPTARALWAASNVAFTVLILWCLFRLLPADTSGAGKLLIAALFLCGTPWRNDVGNGQHALFVLAFFLLAVVVSPRSRVGAGVALAVSWFKYSITFPFSLFFAQSRRGWTAILTAAAVNAALTVFAAFWTATGVFDLLIGPIQVARRTTGRGYLDLFALGARLGLPDAVPAVVVIAVLALTYATLRRDADRLSRLSTLSLVAMAVVFHQIYDFVVLVVPLAYALRERAATMRARYYLALVGVIWFADRIVDAAAGRNWAMKAGALVALYFWSRVLLFYGALAADWLTALKPGRTATTGSVFAD